MNIAQYIDHTILKPATTLEEIRKICAEAIEHKFAAVCVPPPFVKNAKMMVKDSEVKVATVIGFPFGYSVAKAKIFEMQQALEDKADEMDVVVNLIALKAGQWTYLENEIKFLVEAAHKNRRLIKVIIETGILTTEEIIKCCGLYSKMEVDFVKTSTGYAEKGASVEAVQIMKAHLPEHIRIKASGGIRNFNFAKELVDAGADRLGCSASVAIVKGESGEGY